MSESDIQYTLVAEYIWLDGNQPIQNIRSKTKIYPFSHNQSVSLESFPVWTFDGSSTNQATTESSDCILVPVYFAPNPFIANGYLVLCEVQKENFEEHPSNTRKKLRQLMEGQGKNLNIWLGFEQEYVLINPEINRPLGWQADKEPAPQGPYYCASIPSHSKGREIVEEHMQACIHSGLSICGINAEVMLGQWEYQIGYRGKEDEAIDPLSLSDQLILSRFLLYRIAEQFETNVCFDNKPIAGDWNGSGLHTNFSSAAMRNPDSGNQTINKVIAYMKKNHKEQITAYGHNLKSRLTGEHETSNFETFNAGKSSRNTSIRIPVETGKKNCGYLEDRRPGANADPYSVAYHIVDSLLNF